MLPPEITVWENLPVRQAFRSDQALVHHHPDGDDGTWLMPWGEDVVARGRGSPDQGRKRGLPIPDRTKRKEDDGSDRPAPRTEPAGRDGRHPANSRTGIRNPQPGPWPGHQGNCRHGRNIWPRPRPPIPVEPHGPAEASAPGTQRSAAGPAAPAMPRTASHVSSAPPTPPQSTDCEQVSLIHG